jgi:propionyl-CoA carboxylase alpha chain
VRVDGHAIEVRVVAEDPAAGWLPSVGTVSQFDIDAGRVDAGVRPGSEVSSNYDSLVAKVIEHGADRAAVCRRLAASLRRSRVTGVATNVAALAAILTEPDFLAGGVSTAYLAEHPDVERAAGPSGPDLLAHLVAAAVANERAARDGDRVTGFAPSGWRNLPTRGQRRTYEAMGATHQVEYRVVGDRYELLVGPWPEPDGQGALGPDERRALTARLIRPSDWFVEWEPVVFELGGRRWSIDVEFEGPDSTHTHSHAGTVTFLEPPRFVDHDEAAVTGGPICPLPGTVIAVHVAAGDRVDDGQLLMVVEAMKMEHKILAAGAATVTEVRFAVGDRVDSGDLLVALDHDD